VYSLLAPAPDDNEFSVQGGRTLPTPRDLTDNDWIVYFVVDPNRWGYRALDFETLKIQLTRVPEDLPAELNQSLQSAYISYGLSGVDRFTVGVFGLDDYSNFVVQTHAWRFSSQKLRGDALVAALRGHVADDRKDLWAAYEDSYKLLKTYIQSMRARLMKAAQQRLIYAELPNLRVDILRETRRYLSLADDSDQSALTVIKGGSRQSHTELLLGPDGPALLAVILALRPYLNNLRDAETQVSKLGWLKRLTGTAEKIASLSPALPAVLALAQLTAPTPQQLDSASKRLLMVKQSFTEVLSSWAQVYPILYRLLDTAPSLKDAASLAITVTDDVQEAWQASLDAASAFASDAELVWTLPILLDRTIRYGFDPKRDVVAGVASSRDTIDQSAADRFEGESGFAERVAADEVTKLQAKISPLEVINGLLQVVDASTMLIQPEFPVLQLAVFVANILGGLASLLEEYWKSEPLRLTSRAAVDQSHTLSTASPYLTLLMKTTLRSLVLMIDEPAAATAKSAS
jgi:hypothetical protein